MFPSFLVGKAPDFPEDFENNHGVDVDSETINEWIKQGLDYLDQTGESSWYCWSGNTFLFLFRSSYGIEFYVTKDFAQVDIPFVELPKE